MTLNNSLRGIIFHHSVLRTNDIELRQKLHSMITKFRGLGISIAMVSTDTYYDVNSLFASLALAPPDVYENKDSCGARVGSDKIVTAIAASIGCKNYELLYVGHNRYDWYSAINSATFYIHAGWTGQKPEEVTAFSFPQPEDIFVFASHFLMPPPRWRYKLDKPQYGLHVRCLEAAGVTLPCTSPGKAFSLQDVLTYHNDVRIGESKARSVLMLHVLASLYTEGLIEKRSLFTIYPSSTPGRVNDEIGNYVNPGYRVFGAYFQKGLITRAVQADDTSRLRASKQYDRVTFNSQTNTVHLKRPENKKYDPEGKCVIVFDDFTTEGRSMEWARLLFQAAGASKIILTTVGKYPKPHQLHLPAAKTTIQPYEMHKYSSNSFVNEVNICLDEFSSNSTLLKELLKTYIDGEPFLDYDVKV